MSFERFIAVDWSGARKSGKICLAECWAGTSAPRLVQPPESRLWSRSAIIYWLEKEAKHVESKILLGLDFGFAFPYCDEGAYFPGHPESPAGIRDLWATIDDMCLDSKDLYGGPFYKDPTARFGRYLCYQNYRGDLFKSRHRVTEIACAEQATTPTSCFKFVGSEQVGSGSVAGMRFLHALAHNRYTGEFAVWPFDSNRSVRVTIVEIFPRLFYHLGASYSSPATLAKAVQHHGSDVPSTAHGKLTEDEADALVSAAALRSIAADRAIWQPKAMNSCARDYEGWILGVR